MLRRFGAIGDVHGEDAHLGRALAFLRARSVDEILCVGDIVDGRGDVDRCVWMLRSFGVRAVRGNHERWMLHDTMRSLKNATHRADLASPTVDWIASLPPTWTAETVAGTLLLCHAVGDDDMVRLREEDEGQTLVENAALQRVLASGVELMVCGHTHQPMVRSIAGLVVINAGTLHDADGPGFVEVDLEAKVAQFYVLDGARILESVRVPFGRPGQDVWGSGF